jgi:hypothetical protein
VTPGGQAGPKSLGTTRRTPARFAASNSGRCVSSASAEHTLTRKSTPFSTLSRAAGLAVPTSMVCRTTPWRCHLSSSGVEAVREITPSCCVVAGQPAVPQFGPWSNVAHEGFRVQQPFDDDLAGRAGSAVKEEDGLVALHGRVCGGWWLGREVVPFTASETVLLCICRGRLQ